VTHPKAKLTPAGRLLLVQRVLVEHWPPAHAAAMSGVSRQTLYKWLQRFQAQGFAGLEDRSSRPHHCPHHTGADVEAQVLEVRAQIRKGPHLVAGRRLATIRWLSRRLGETDWERMWEVDRQNATCHAR